MVMRAAIALLFGVLAAVFPASAKAPQVGKDTAASVSPAEQKLDRQFEAFARDLVRGILAQRRFSLGSAPRVVIWPYKENETAIPLTVAREYNERLLTAMIAEAKGRLDFVARAALGTLIADMQATGALDARQKNPINALMKSARKVDYLVEGTLRLERDFLNISYKAVGMDGTIAAQTGPARIHVSAAKVSATRAEMTLDKAVEEAARYLSDNASDMEEMVLGGIRFQTSGAQPEFGLYLQEKLSARIQTLFASSLTERRLRVVRSAGRACAQGGRGIRVEERKSRNAGQDAGRTFKLSGTYWDFGESLELRVSLVDACGESVSWNRRIRTDDVHGLKIRPSEDVSGLRENDGLGPVGLELSTTRGDDPAYRIGETMDLTLRLDRDAWVYCFYRQADGKTIQIFPNEHFWKRFVEPKLEGTVVHTIPAETTFPFTLRLSEPPGVELVKCFAAGRNVTADLPPELRGMSFKPVSEEIVRRMSRIFRSLPSAAVSEGSIAVTVYRQEVEAGETRGTLGGDAPAAGR